MHILLIVDDTATRNTLTSLFKAEKHQITAFTIAEAVVATVPKTIKAVLLDMNIEKMPEDDVTVALSRIVAQTPTLVLYGNHPNDTEVKKLALGPCELMHKKCDVSVLVQKLESFKMSKLKAA